MRIDPDLIQRVLKMAAAIQQVAAPTFAEQARAAFVLEQFRAEGLCDVALDAAGNAFGRLPGSGEAPPLVVSAHLDTVFPQETDLTLQYSADQIAGPGIGDNSTGVAGLFGLLWMLRDLPGQPSRLPGDIWLAANVGEEGLGDLRGMQAVVERFGKQAKAYVILEGMALGQVYHRGLGVRRYQIGVQTGGGHSWVDYGNPSAIHELAALVTALAALPLPEKPRTTLNVGVISGGTSVNTIAAGASLLLDLRSEDPQALAALCGQVEKLARAAERPGVRLTIEVVGQRPAGAIPANHPLVRLAAHSLELAGVQPKLNIGSTDANAPLSQGLPAVCVGLTTGSGAHTLNEAVQIPPLAKGLAALLRLVEGVYA